METVAMGRNKELDPRSLGWWLRRNRDRIIGGMQLESLGETSGVARWRVAEISGGHGGHGGHLPAPSAIRRFPRLGNTPAQDGTIKRFPRLPKNQQKSYTNTLWG